jgi:urease accessory protein
LTEFVQLLLADGRFPAGGHAHSGGLEAAVAAGLEAAGVPAFVAGRLRGSTGPEAHLVVAARRAAMAGDLAGLAELGEEADARCPSPPLRETARRLGSQLLRTARAVFPDAALLARYPEPGAPAPRPVAFGVVAAAGGLGDLGAARAYLYDDAATVATAAVRLLPLDPGVAFRWVAEQRTVVEELALWAAACRVPAAELPAPFAPLLELGSLAHARAERSLFAS